MKTNVNRLLHYLVHETPQIATSGSRQLPRKTASQLLRNSSLVSRHRSGKGCRSRKIQPTRQSRYTPATTFQREMPTRTHAIFRYDQPADVRSGCPALLVEIYPPGPSLSLPSSVWHILRLRERTEDAGITVFGCFGGCHDFSLGCYRPAG